MVPLSETMGWWPGGGKGVQGGDGGEGGAQVGKDECPPLPYPPPLPCWPSLPTRLHTRTPST